MGFQIIKGYSSAQNCKFLEKFLENFPRNEHPHGFLRCLFFFILKKGKLLKMERNFDIQGFSPISCTNYRYLFLRS